MIYCTKYRFLLWWCLLQPTRGESLHVWLFMFCLLVSGSRPHLTTIVLGCMLTYLTVVRTPHIRHSSASQAAEAAGKKLCVGLGLSCILYASLLVSITWTWIGHRCRGYAVCPDRWQRRASHAEEYCSGTLIYPLPELYGWQEEDKSSRSAETCSIPASIWVLTSL